MSKLRKSPLVGIIGVLVPTLLFLTVPDTEFSKLQLLRQRPMLEQLAKRDCPKTGHVGALESGSLPETYRLGPYEITLPNGNYKDLQGFLVQSVGESSIVEGNFSNSKSVDRAWIRLKTLGPDMYGGVLIASDYMKYLRRGNLYYSELSLQYAKDGRYVAIPPMPREIPQIPPSEKLEKTSIGLLIQNIKTGQSGDEIIAIPESSNPPNFVIKCSRESGSIGFCEAFHQVRSDIWVNYSFPFENLRCWSGIETEVNSFLVKASKNWTQIH